MYTHKNKEEKKHQKRNVQPSSDFQIMYFSKKKKELKPFLYVFLFSFWRAIFLFIVFVSVMTSAILVAFFRLLSFFLFYLFHLRFCCLFRLHFPFGQIIQHLMPRWQFEILLGHLTRTQQRPCHSMKCGYKKNALFFDCLAV